MMKRLHPLMLMGTGSDVGKSVLAAAFCRIFRQDGYDPAPFKAQNMALNSFVTADGGEMGRAQVVQAEAAGVACHTDMNPLLLKPNSDRICQVILNGRPVGNREAADLFAPTAAREELRREVLAAYDRLAARFNPIVLEGAGSISEINLRDADLVNMPMAIHAGADVFLVADIDRGGVFGSVYGSVMLLRPEERRRLKGILINKFRGDIRLFETGRGMLEELCGVPVLGVIPYFRDIAIESEDSLGPEAMLQSGDGAGRVKIAVVLVRHLSNFTDFDALGRHPGVRLTYAATPQELDDADIVVLPGSKSTIPDLKELWGNGMAQRVIRAHEEGKTVVGICGGFQMLGRAVHDPAGVESGIATLPGLGLLPVETVLDEAKITRQVRFRWGNDPRECSGYEIHMGRTKPVEGAPAVPGTVTDLGETGGYRLGERCWGTYIHGILDNPAVTEALLAPFKTTPAASPEADYAAFKEVQYDRLAALVRRHADMDRIYEILTAEQ